MATYLFDKIARRWPWSFRKDKEQPVTTRETAEHHLSRVLGPFENYTVKFQRILIWENPAISALSVLVVHILFWFAVNCEQRFYGIAFTAVLLVYLYGVWVNQVWPVIKVPSTDSREYEEWTPLHPSVLSVPEISRYLAGAWTWSQEFFSGLVELRRDQPGKFCTVVSLAFMLLAVIGHIVPGIVLSYFVVMGLMIGPAIFLRLPPSMKARCQGVGCYIQQKIMGSSTGNELEEYVPEPTREEMDLLNRAGESLDNISDEENDELAVGREYGIDINMRDTVSLTPGVDVMPPYDENTNTSIETADLIPTEPLDEAGSSDEEHSQFAAGLSFSQETASLLPGQETSSLPFSQGSAFLQTLAGAAMMSALQSQIETKKQDSSDTEADEFEIISKDDLR